MITCRWEHNIWNYKPVVSTINWGDCFFLLPTKYVLIISEPTVSGWWLNQPIWKICSSKWVNIFPKFRDENSKNLWVATTQVWFFKLSSFQYSVPLGHVFFGGVFDQLPRWIADRVSGRFLHTSLGWLVVKFQPIRKNMRTSDWIHLPQGFGVNIFEKNIWNHHL